MSAKTKITEEISQIIIELALQGNNPTFIGKKVKLAKDTVKSFLERKNIPIHKRTNVNKKNNLLQQESKFLELLKTASCLKDIQKSANMHYSIAVKFAKIHAPHLLRSRAEAAIKDKRMSISKAQLKVPEGSTVVGYDPVNKKFVIKDKKGQIHKKSSSRLNQGKKRVRTGIITQKQINRQKEKNARVSIYRAKKVNATPAWADIDAINDFYKKCPKGYHVDHIYPIRSDFVCGLHVIDNLKYIPEMENVTKGSAIIDDKVGVCHQYVKRMETMTEDIESGFLFNLSSRDFVLSYEGLCDEHRIFIEKYEWLGNIGYNPKWVFTARYNNSLAGVVMIGEPTAPTRDMDKGVQAQITRGACSSWAPKNLNSKLVMFAINWCAKNTNKKIFYAYSDHDAGEIGTIYQACNFIYLGATFGRHESYKLKNGKIVSSRYFYKGSTICKYAKELGIEIKKEYYKANGYLDIKALPKEDMEKIKQKAIEDRGNSTMIPARPKGKYAIVLGKDSRETKKLRSQVNIPSYPYPKRVKNLLNQ